MNLLHRRTWLALAAAALLAGCASTPPPAPAPVASGEAQPPIVFVHGNGDSAALWHTTMWRWESNGWPRERLHAVNFPYPLARDDNSQAQAGRSGSDEQRAHLAAEVDRVLAATGARQLVLMANSRGGNAVRDCIATPAEQGGCAGKVSHAILGGTPNHGVWANAGFRPNNEFNGAGPFLTRLNAPKGPNGDEVTPGLKWLTIRSDNNDKFAQPDGVWIGAKGTPTNVSFDGPALKGAENVVLPGRDHREVSYHADAFAQAYRFVTGRAPASLAITPQPRITLDGLATGASAAGPSNLPLAGARVTVYAVDAQTGERRGAALLDKTTGADGRWGPLETDSRTALEFVLASPVAGQATVHIYRAPFLRSSSLVHLRPERLAPADAQAGAVVQFTRPRGYFGLPRDQILLDGQAAPGIPPGVAGVASSKLLLPAEAVGRAVVGDYRSGSVAERIVGRSWPAKDGHLTVLELHE
ncbi:MAG: twin-arginine translocation pathway signal [Burkholderiaceae bacterium]|nr:twin-arginine translocation pathway signal [Burkholderiaceae bacterium]